MKFCKFTCIIKKVVKTVILGDYRLGDYIHFLIPISSYNCLKLEKAAETRFIAGHTSG